MKITLPKNMFQLVALRQPELKQRSFISAVQNFRMLFHLYFTSLLFVPVFKETLRKYPIINFLDRISCSKYELSAPTGNGTITLPAGTGVYIPVFALHHEPTYFPEKNQRSSTQTVSQRKTNTVVRNTHIFR
jgi:cytochrome P450